MCREAVGGSHRRLRVFGPFDPAGGCGGVRGSHGLMTTAPTLWTAALGAPTELDVCRRFQNGECSFSDCKFAHPEVHVSVASNGKVSVCRQFLTGQCAEAACSQYHLPDHLRHRDWNEEKHAKRPRLAGASMSMWGSRTGACVTGDVEAEAEHSSCTVPCAFTERGRPPLPSSRVWAGG